MVEGLLWLSMALVLYTYLGYPVLVDLVSRLRRRAGAAAGDDAAEAPLLGRQCELSIHRQFDRLNTAQVEVMEILLP